MVSVATLDDDSKDLILKEHLSEDITNPVDIVINGKQPSLGSPLSSHRQVKKTFSVNSIGSQQPYKLDVDTKMQGPSLVINQLQQKLAAVHKDDVRLI